MQVDDVRCTARTIAGILAVPLLATFTACESAPANEWSPLAQAAATRPERSMVVDSALPMPELLARFQAASAARPDSLAGGTQAMESLVQRYLAALQRSDTSGIRQLAVSRAEYAHLVFPGSVMARPPYELDPEVAWMLLEVESEKGVSRALAFVNAQLVAYAGVHCPEPRIDRASRSWRGCTVALRHPDNSRSTARLFGEIVEVKGRHKFLSYANPLPPRPQVD